MTGLTMLTGLSGRPLRAHLRCALRHFFFPAFAALLALLPPVNEAGAQSGRKSRFRSGGEVRHAGGGSGHADPKPSLKSYSKKFNVVEEGGKKILYKKQNTVEFDDSLIEGEIRNPSDFYFVHRPEEKFGSLLQKRKNFHKEMLRDSVLIR